MQSFSSNNKRFYDRSTKAWLQQLAELKGLSHNEDLEAMRELISASIGHSGAVLEVGCGYGRVSSWLHINFPDVAYTGIDLSENSIAYCRRYAIQNERARFIATDVLNLDLEEKFDLILWVWGGILELNNEDKLRALQKLAPLLSEDGILFMDLPIDINAGEKLVFQGDRIVEQHSGFGYALNQLISPNKLSKMLEQVGLFEAGSVSYRTGKGLQRKALRLKKGVGHE